MIHPFAKSTSAMEKWKYKVNLWDRIKFAWHAFWLTPFSKTYPFVVRCGELVKEYTACDIGGVGTESGCGENANHCVSRPTITIGIQLEEHHHVCDNHNKNREWLTNED